MRKTVNAYAKINLFLDITELRSDGYHNIQSVMQSVSLCDIVDVEIIGENAIKIECDDLRVPCGEKNIAYRAAELFLTKANKTCGVFVKIKKSIPMAAGLAGGSADAAAVLVGLNEIFESYFSIDELCAIGSKIGADVPFCIRCGCSYLEGIGDLFFKFPSIPKDVTFVIACGGEGVSTKEAYSLLDQRYDNFKNYSPKGVESLKNALDTEDKYGFFNAMFNIFEGPVLEQRATVGELKDLMLSFGASAAMMSGSGPSVFGVFLSNDMALEAVEAIKNAGHFATVAYPVDERYC